MLLLLLVLALCLPAVADPTPVKTLFGTPAAIRVERNGQGLRLAGDSPLKVRTRMVGTKMRVDVSPATSLVGRLPQGIALSRPASDTMRLEWAVPPRTVATCVRSADGRATRVTVSRAKTGPTRKTISHHFVNADIVYVIKVLAKEMGRKLYIGPGVEGSLTVSLRSVPAEAALALILALHEGDVDYKLVSNGSGGQTLIVAPQGRMRFVGEDVGCSCPACNPVVIPQGEGMRQEILLDKAPAAKVMEFLQGQYKNVQFTAHPTMNGFYVYGTRKDVLQIKAEVPTLDRIPDPPPPPVSEFIAVKYGDINEIKALLATLVPDVEYEVADNTLKLTGQPGAVEQVRELMVEFDRPSEQIVIDAKLVDLTATQRKALGLESVRPHIHVLARTPFRITSALQFLVTSSEARVLAAPRVATEADKPTTLHIGDKQVPLTSFDPVRGEFANPTMDLGLTVKVLPSLKADGYLTLQLNVATSFVTELVSHQYPCLTIHRDTHQLRVKDGDTVILSNLLPADAIKAAQAHPLLRDLPITGTILRSVKPDSQIVLMLTPHIMR